MDKYKVWDDGLDARQAQSIMSWRANINTEYAFRIRPSQFAKGQFQIEGLKLGYAEYIELKRAGFKEL